MTGGKVIRGRVVKVVDGDTIVVKTAEGRVTVHLAGVDAPESHPTIKLQVDARQTGLPYSRIQRWGMASARFTTKLCQGRRVKMKGLGRRRVKSGGILALVRLPGGRDVSAEVIGAGYGLVTRGEPRPVIEGLLKLEALAKKEGRGLWADPRWSRYAVRVEPRSDHLFFGPNPHYS